MRRGDFLSICGIISLAIAGTDSVRAEKEAVAGEVTVTQTEIDRIVAQEEKAYSSGDYATAAKLGLRLYEYRKALLGERDPATIETYDNYAVVIGALGRTEEAYAIHAVTVPLAREILGDRHPDTLFYIANLGSVLVDLGRREEALPLLREAWESRRDVLGTAHSEALYSLETYANLIEELGQLATAEPLFAQVIEIRKASATPDIPKLDAAFDKHASVLELLGRLDEAAARYAELADIRTQELGVSHAQTLDIRLLQGKILDSSGKSAEALVLYTDVRAKAAAALKPDNLTRLVADNNYAQALTGLGRTDEAEPILKRTISLLRTSAGTAHPTTLKALGNYAALLSVQGRDREAMLITAEILKTLTEQPGADDRMVAVAHNNYARLVLNTGDTAKAEPLLAQAVDKTSAALGPNHPDTLVSLFNHATALSLLGRHEDAIVRLDALMKAYEKAEETGLPLARAQYQYGVTLVLQQQYEKAEPLLSSAYKAVREFYGDTHQETLNALGALAMSHFASGDAEEALEFARRLANAVRLRRSTLGFDPRSQAQSERTIALRTDEFMFLATLDVLLAERDPSRAPQLHAEALLALQEISGGSTSRALAQMAARRKAEQSGGLATLARERQALADRWQEAEAEITAGLAASDAQSGAARTVLETEITQIEKRLAKVDAKLRKKAPEYYALTRPEPLGLDQIQALLAPDEAAVLSVPGQFGTLTIAVTRAGLTVRRSDLTVSEITEKVRGLRADLDPTSQNWAVRDLPLFDRATAYELYQELFQSLEAALSGKRHVFLATSGPLASLPLGVLVTGTPEGGDDDPEALRNTPWFADRHALIQIPSLQSLQILRVAAARAGRNSDDAELAPFMGFGDPMLSGKGRLRSGPSVAGIPDVAEPGTMKALLASTTRGGVMMADPAMLRRLAELPGTQRELEDIRIALKAPASSIFIRDAATETAVRSAKLANVAVIAFATHALMPDELDGVVEPALVLSPPAVATQEDDGLLSASEVTTLDLTAEWVILSACNTAAGGEQGGDALSGLARAFFYAGARSLLASHWPVFDKVAPVLTTRTIQLRQENPGISRAEALQRAMREVRESAQDPVFAHPSVWAPFALIGDAD